MAALGELFASRIPDPERLQDAGAFLYDPDLNARRLAIEVLVMYGADGVPSLIRGLDEPQPTYLRAAAAVALGRLGRDAVPAIPALCACLESEDEELRSGASFALGRIGPEAVPALRTTLGSPNPDVSVASINALESMDEGAAEALEDLRTLASVAPSPMIRIASLSAIARITADPSAVVPDMLLVAQGAQDEPVRKGCVERVANLGGLAKGFAPNLVAFTRDVSPSVRSVAALGLAKTQMDPSRAVPVLTTMLDDPDEGVRQQVIIALTCFGPAGADALPALIRVKEQGTEKLADMAAAAIEQITRIP